VGTISIEHRSGARLCTIGSENGLASSGVRNETCIRCCCSFTVKYLNRLWVNLSSISTRVTIDMSLEAVFTIPTTVPFSKRTCTYAKCSSHKRFAQLHRVSDLSYKHRSLPCMAVENMCMRVDSEVHSLGKTYDIATWLTTSSVHYHLNDPIPACWCSFTPHTLSQIALSSILNLLQIAARSRYVTAIFRCGWVFLDNFLKGVFSIRRLTIHMTSDILDRMPSRHILECTSCRLCIHQVRELSRS
jgi:hypothetical protein